MSTWTHICGMIRVDSFRIFNNITNDLHNLFKTCSFDGPREEWNKCTVPCGSEGSLKVTIWENPDKESLASHTISIFGDLRDYGKSRKKEFVAWWKHVLKECENEKKGCWIRNAIINFEFEDGGHYALDKHGHLYRFQEKKKEEE